MSLVRILHAQELLESCFPAVGYLASNLKHILLGLSFLVCSSSAWAVEGVHRMKPATNNSEAWGCLT
jgi:hypothetical protein